jgi:hypothetical protein
MRIPNPLSIGIVWKDGQILNHRSILKVVLNPFLGCFLGKVIGTLSNAESTELGDLKWVECSGPWPLWKMLKAHWCYDHEDVTVELRRVFW